MFVIHYFQNRSIVAVEGPFEASADARNYLDERGHYLDMKARVLSVSPPRRNTASKIGASTDVMPRLAHEADLGICCAIAPRGSACSCGSSHIGC
ncbi:hypothetical protein ACOI1H_16210 [Loktanella sp. DJP18]|uniref:hypothetical protein n=1 Tax=Loktanella sp. DJP18 TaxID=3409788 RepID=UPI003BB50621